MSFVLGVNFLLGTENRCVLPSRGFWPDWGQVLKYVCVNMYL